MLATSTTSKSKPGLENQYHKRGCLLLLHQLQRNTKHQASCSVEMPIWMIWRIIWPPKQRQQCKSCSHSSHLVSLDLTAYWMSTQKLHLLEHYLGLTGYICAIYVVFFFIMKSFLFLLRRAWKFVFTITWIPLFLLYVKKEMKIFLTGVS